MRLNILLYPCEEDSNKWVAHCMKLDVLAVERDIPGAILLLDELVNDLVDDAKADGTLEQIFTPAPAKYWQIMLFHAERYKLPRTIRRRRFQAPLPIDRVDYAQAVT